jgi:hypothetical protein
MSLRKRIGVMVPSTNTTFEADFQMVAPRDVTIHGQRLWLTNDAAGAAGMDRMNGEVEAGARYLATARVDVIAYGCTTGSFYRGPGWDRDMLDLIRRAAGVPAVATSPSVVEALRFFGARAISVATRPTLTGTTSSFAPTSRRSTSRSSTSRVSPARRRQAIRGSTTSIPKTSSRSPPGRVGPRPTRSSARARRGARSRRWRSWSSAPASRW